MEDLKVLSTDPLCPLVSGDPTDSQLVEALNQPSHVEANDLPACSTPNPAQANIVDWSEEVQCKYLEGGNNLFTLSGSQDLNLSLGGYGRGREGVQHHGANDIAPGHSQGTLQDCE